MKLLRAHITASLVPLLRTPMFWIPMVIFPSLWFCFFALPNALRYPEAGPVLLASWSAFAVIGVGFFQFGVSIAQARVSKWEDYARTLPVGAGPRLIAQIVTAAIFTALALGLLWLLAIATGAVHMTPSQFAELFAVLSVGAIPFVLLGAGLGYIMPPRGAVPIANLIYLPLAYFGGLWIPPNFLPEFAAKISMYTPTRHLGELAWASGLGHALPFASLKVLAIYAAIGAAMAWFGWRRDEAARAL